MLKNVNEFRNSLNGTRDKFFIKKCVIHFLKCVTDDNTSGKTNREKTLVFLKSLKRHVYNAYAPYKDNKQVYEYYTKYFINNKSILSFLNTICYNFPFETYTRAEFLAQCKYNAPALQKKYTDKVFCWACDNDGEKTIDNVYAYCMYTAIRQLMLEENINENEV